jgi:hypothetical protein
MTAPVASGGSEIAGWAFHPLERCRLFTAHTRNKPLILIAHSQPHYARALPAAIPTTIGSRVVLLADHYVADVAADKLTTIKALALAIV